MFLTKEERLNRWGETRKRGMRRFILVNGVVIYGLFTATFFTLAKWMTSPEFNPYVVIPIAFILFPLSGLGVGWALWRGAEKSYKERTEDSST